MVSGHALGAVERLRAVADAQPDFQCQECCAHTADIAALVAEVDRLRAALAEAEARAALAPVADDYPSAVFKELWRVLQELRAGTGAEGRA